MQRAGLYYRLDILAARALLKSEAESLWGLLSAGAYRLRPSKLDALRAPSSSERILALVLARLRED